jgi:hypothetical protein
MWRQRDALEWWAEYGPLLAEGRATRASETQLALRVERS